MHASTTWNRVSDPSSNNSGGLEARRALLLVLPVTDTASHCWHTGAGVGGGGGGSADVGGGGGGATNANAPGGWVRSASDEVDDLAAQLERNVLREQQSHWDLTDFVWLSTLSPVQGARVVAASYTYIPDALAIMHACRQVLRGA
ncbi:hypothetical protein HYH02_010241 [Chlamydomonas schloesseri]|uniref:Uncharacterized protein n=1 Tax=Chlamydomonas schloesseri TaxID=2026947 RepID=A0A835T834_9CHLO|nr:hypothetical protein HYH02_010241 [Chlamydomonas schloesseri]|eukprot:KAG2440662.1 hypothetical protein HYH02_010241 [Chlamydomonas schloesseri]